MRKLKPCFCGSDAVLTRIGNDFTKKRSVKIKCSNAYCRVEHVSAGIRNSHDEVEATAIHAWNNRPIEDAQAAKIARLEKALELACDDMCRSMRCSDCIAEPACQEDTYPLTDHYMQKAKEATDD